MNEVATAMEEMTKRLRGTGLVPVTVVSVNVTDYTFDAKDGADNDYQDVRMNATTGKSGALLVPAVGSSVIITDLGNQAQDWVMLLAGEVSDVLLVAGGGAQVQSAVRGEDLNTNLAQLLTALDGLTTALTAFGTANVAASAGVLAPLAPAYSALNTALPNVKNQLATVRQQLSSHLSETIQLT